MLGQLGVVAPHRLPQPVREPAQHPHRRRSSSAARFLVVVGGVAARQRRLLDEPQHHRQRRRPHPGLQRPKSKDELAIWPMGGNDPDLSPLTTSASVTQRRWSRCPTSRRSCRWASAARSSPAATPSTSRSRSCANVVRGGEGAGPDARSSAERRASQKEHVRQIVRVLQADLARANEINTAQALDPDARAAVQTASSDRFWADFDSGPLRRRWSSSRTRSPRRPPTPTCSSSATSAPTSTRSSSPSTA